MKNNLAILLFLSTTILFAQEQSPFAKIPFENVGPTVMSGRVVDLAVNPENPTHFYVAYASGGLWETKNNGTTFQAIFDNQAVMTIGDIAVDWKTGKIWIGTGENNSSRSSYAGNGIYTSINNGETWEHQGLPESHHIGRILLHPENSEIAWVAALGHLYSPNKERGIYKTTDGGKTWKQTLFVQEDAGAIDLIMHPQNPKELYVAIWERSRRAWNFVESGKSSGIYKSIDGGENWTLVTTEKSGFPTGEGVGRIGLDIYNNGKETVIYAVLDNQFRREKEADKTKDEEPLSIDELEQMTKAQFLKIKKERIEQYLKSQGFPKKYDVETVIELVENNTIEPRALVDYVKDANTALFDTPVIGAEVYRSTNGGASWKKCNDDYIDDLYYSYGYYFGQIRVAPQDEKQVYIMGVPILKSNDGGKTFESISAPNVHADHHALWCNPKQQGHLINGNDGGVNISYDNGENWIKCNSPAVGQFYAVNVDNAEPYNIYGGLQDNGVWVGSSNYKASTAWHQSGHYGYKTIMGGDGMQIQIDNRDNNTVYTGYQFGNYFRINKTTGVSQYIQPKHELGEQKLRFNWQTPILLSSHNQDILYLGSNKLHRSFNKGDDFKTISADLTKGGKKGDVAYGTLTSISESIFQFGLIYTGSDDGKVQVTKDGGQTWTDVSITMPKDMWVSRVQASKHNKSTVYLALNGYRWDDFGAYIYKSDDYGDTWQQIGINVPRAPVNVILEDPVNPSLLYVGTDNGLYVSLDKGVVFLKMGDLANAPVHDLVIQPSTNDLIVGTHGRSIYKRNIKELQELTAAILEKEFHVFKIKNRKHNKRWGSSWSKWATANEPSINIPIFIKNARKIKLEIKDETGKTVAKQSYNLDKGLQYLNYDLSTKDKSIDVAKNGKRYLKAGKYTLIFKPKLGEKVEMEWEITERKRQHEPKPSTEEQEQW